MVAVEEYASPFRLNLVWSQ